MGIWLIPMGLGMMLISNAGAAISAAHGPRVTLTIAGVVIAVGYALTATVCSLSATAHREEMQTTHLF
ncbi:hypothetical protein cgR_2838 [Corynebacterium glutamicum R]|uniref:Uncharacterized protein n=1 Tax=Corynebacterium glutamicum (strain R) TaxID=340322 RepID=A0AB72VE14_CORGB|nr:hypothetical protein cgR_2838 [Corynebacterium glutamicum R]